jgi:glycerol-3-phosphate dehydrogenase
MELGAPVCPTLGEAVNRDLMLQHIEENSDVWDILIIGGGATGLGAAVDAATRGFRTLLLEQHDFAKGTSSRSTKLIHGGLRYLQQGNIALVIEALRERGLLCANAPHLVHHLPFLVPNYHWWEGPFYGVGLKVYDMLAGKLGLEPSRHLNRKETLKMIPTLEKKGLRGGVVYYDGQFDDARLAITLAKTAADHGAVLVNYMRVSSLLKSHGLVTGVRATDLEAKKHYTLHAKVVINATGIFSDHLRKADDPRAKPLMSPSQGIHLVLPRHFLPTQSAILVPHTDDHRVIFLVPWLNKVIVGTTDTPIKKPLLEPRARKEEIAFLLKHAGRYLTRHPTEKDVLAVFAGLRPLVKSSNSKETSALSRDHVIAVSKSGLITIAGGKWTTYRKMAQDVIDKAITLGHLPERPCVTTNLPLHGTDAKTMRLLIRKNKTLKKRLHPKLPYTVADVIWAVRTEMARSVEDVLSRRTRALLLDVKASLETAPLVAKIVAKELGKSKTWIQNQLKAYANIAKNYYLNPPR